MVSMRFDARVLMLLLVAVVVALRPHSEAEARKKVKPPADEQLDLHFYDNTCPDAKSIIYKRVKYWLDKDRTLGPAIIRLHFHDCMVRGCDASILLDYEGSEREAYASRTLRGFEVMDDIKKALEKSCPATVSCADILTVAARDAATMLGAPFWLVPVGRRDGFLSLAREADNVPSGQESVTQLLTLFQSRGLSLLDLVVLSGAHTIGRCACRVLENRLYHFNGTRHADLRINSSLLTSLQSQCRYGWKWNSQYANLDNTTPTTFDNVYYKNLQQNKGVLLTDQLLQSDPRTAFLVDTFAKNPGLFLQQFAASMTRLSKVGVLVGDEGQVRTTCSRVRNDAAPA